MSDFNPDYSTTPPNSVNPFFHGTYSHMTHTSLLRFGRQDSNSNVSNNSRERFTLTMCCPSPSKSIPVPLTHFVRDHELNPQGGGEAFVYKRYCISVWTLFITWIKSKISSDAWVFQMMQIHQICMQRASLCARFLREASGTKILYCLLSSHHQFRGKVEAHHQSQSTSAPPNGYGGCPPPEEFRRTKWSR